MDGLSHLVKYLVKLPKLVFRRKNLLLKTKLIQGNGSLKHETTFESFI